MTPLERLALWASCAVGLVLFGGVSIGLAAICTPGEMALMALLLVASAGFIGHAYGVQVERDEIERRLKCRG